MRVSFALSSEKMLQNINRKNEDIDSLSWQVSSGLRMQRPADDPVAWAKAMDLETGLKQLDTFSKNMDFAINWGNATEQALTQIQEIVVSAKNVAIRSINANSNESIAAFVGELNQLLERAVPLANGKYQDRYLFNVNGGTAPFELATDLSAVTGPADTTVLSDELKVRVGQNEWNTVNVDGEEAFLITDADGQPSNIFQELIVLRDAIEAGDTDAVSEQMDILDTAREQLSAQQISVVGANMSNLEQRQEVLLSLQTDVRDRLSQTEDVDMVEAIMQLQQNRTIFESALQVTSMMNDLTLAKFL